MRRYLVREKGARKADFFPIGDFRSHILEQPKESPDEYTIICRTSMGPNPHVEVLGSGAHVLRVLNQGFNHFVPIWPPLGKRGRGGDGEPPEEPPAKKPGKELTEVKSSGRSGTGAHYYNYVSRYLRFNPESSVEGAVSHLVGKFTGLSPDDKLKANVGCRLKQARGKVEKMMADLSNYANRKPTARLYVAAQMYVKVSPLASGEETIRKMSRLWKRELTGEETESVLRSVAEYREKNPAPDEFVRVAKARAPRPPAAPQRGNSNSVENDRSAGGGGGESEEDAETGAGKMQAIYSYLKSNVVPSEGPYSRVDNLKRAANRFALKGGKMYTTGPAPKRVCVTEKERSEALKHAHDADVAGHWGWIKTWDRLKGAAYWPGRAKDAAKYVSTCRECQLRGSGDLKVRAPMGTIPYPVRPFRLVACDLKQLPATADGLKWMAVVVCHATKFVEAGALPSKTAENAAEFLFREVFAMYGFVRYMLTGRGKEFCNEVSTSLAAKMGISKRCTSPYHPQANWVAERTIGILADRLAKSAREAGPNWVKRLPAALMAIRTSINFSTGFAPLSLLTGRDFVSPMFVALNGVEDIDGDELEEQFAREDANRKAAGNDELEYEEYVFNYQRICNPKLPFFLDDDSGGDDVATPVRRTNTQKEPRVAGEHRETKAAAKKMRMTARRNVEKVVARNKKYYDKKWNEARAQVEEGAQILVKVGQFTQRMHGRLKYKYAGPFTVTAVNGRAVKYKDAGKEKAKTLQADMGDVKMFNKRKEC